jgi:REP element-mobilizing transposase RayT
MPFNPNIHHRQSVRLRGFDYAKEGFYFVTICVQNRVCLFGDVQNKSMILNQYGEIAHRKWEQLPQHWPHIKLGAFQIMPNHLHGIIILERPATEDAVGMETQLSKACDPAHEDARFSQIQWATRPTLGQIVGAYKSLVANECLKWQKENQPDLWLEQVWQRGFHEKVISTTEALDNISRYILRNPQDWQNDQFFAE